MANKRITRSYGGLNITIGDAFVEFISEKALGGCAEQTIENYRKSLIYYLKYTEYDNDTPIEKVDKESFVKWLSKMRAKKMKHTTINHYIRDVRTFAYWCMDAEREYITPTYEIRQVKGQEPGLKSFKEEQIKILLEKPRKYDSFGEWRSWAIVNWVMATGNRGSTICEVKLEDIDFKRKMITLRHTKNKQFQAVPLSTELSHQLKEYINLWLRESLPSDYLFPSVTGEALTPNALRHSFARYCNGRGIEQTNLHGLRHSFAEISLDTGRNPFELQKMLGHSTLDMTKRYIHFHDNKVEKDFDKHTPLDNMRKPVTRRRKIQRTL